MAQMTTFGPGKFVSLIIYPLTRFSYVHKMLYNSRRNKAILRDMPDAPGFTRAKKKASQGRLDRSTGLRAHGKRDDFTKYEELSTRAGFWNKVDAAMMIFGPLSSMLHYLEGDRIMPSVVLPLFYLYYIDMQHLDTDITSALNSETIAAIPPVIARRWLGTTGARALVGLRNPLHCFAFLVDVYTRTAIVHIFGKGTLDLMDQSYTETILHECLLNKCGGAENAKYTSLLSGMMAFQGRNAMYDTKLKAVELVVGKAAATAVSTLTVDIKKSKVRTMIAVLKGVAEVNTSISFWKAVFNESTSSEADKTLATTAIEALSVTPHACGVERANKNMDRVYSKERSAFGSTNIVKSLFIYHNGNLLHKNEASFESTVQGALSREDAEEVMLHLNFRNMDDSDDDVLPAEESDEDNNDSDEEGVECTEDYEVPDGFSALEKPEALLTGDFVNGLFILFLRAHGKYKRWCLAKVVRHKPRARIYNYDVIYEGQNEGERPHGLNLENYYAVDGGGEPDIGAWVFLRASAPAAGC